MANGQSERLNGSARLFIVAIGIGGFVAILLTFRTWPPAFSAAFVLYLLLGLAGAGMQVPYPGGAGSLSVSTVITMLALLELGPSGALVVSMTGAAAQTFWRTKMSAKTVHLLFNITSRALAVLAAACFFQLSLPGNVVQSELLRLTLAGLAYFVVNMGLLAMIIALTELKSFVTVWRSFSYWAFFYYLLAVALAELVHISSQRLGWSFTLALLPLLYAIYRSCKVYFEKLEQERGHAQNMAALHLRTIEALAMAIEAKDECTHDHLRRVQVYSLELAKHLGLPEEDLNALQAASILHDVGKLAVPDYIISKPGKLTPEEFEKMKIHTIVGAEILEQVAFPYAVAPIVRSHHEKWDGSGYPDGISGEEIPIGARILSAVDCLDALASDRQYRRALPLDEAMDYVAGLSGRSFDPRVIDILKAHYREFERLAQSTPAATTRLRKDIVVTRGGAPDAGYEKNEAAAVPGSRERANRQAASLSSARREMQAILDLAQDVSGALRPEELLSLAAERLKHIVTYDCIAVYILEGEILKPRYVSGENSRAFSMLQIPAGQGLSGWVAENGKPIVNGNPSVEPGYLNDPSRFSVLNSALSIPLRDTGERITGALTLYRSDKDAYTNDHLRILLATSDKIGRIVDAALKLAPQEETHQDELTGLANADSLYSHLQRELAMCEINGKTLVLLACDVDGFKQVKDHHGHVRGDELLKRVASILQGSCRGSDFVARTAGDEFMVVFSGAEPADLTDRLESLDQLVRQTSVDMFGDESIGINVGLACFPDQGTDADSLVAFAQQEMERVKQSRETAETDVLQLARSMR